jgi:hypothetical protein
MSETNMTPEEVLAVLRRLGDLAFESGADEGPEGNEPAHRLWQQSIQVRTAVAAMIASNAEQAKRIEAAMDICRKLAALRDGLDNSNSSAEEMASRLAHKAHNLVARAEAGHG